MRTWILIFAVSIAPFAGSAQLAGTYTIGGASPDFTNFTKGIDSLKAVGISGAVAFNVRAGTYLERLVIPQIAGVSAVNTITFQSEGGDSTLVILQQTSNPWDTNYVVFMNGADYITFKQMTFKGPQSGDAGIFLVDSGAHHNRWLNNFFLADSNGMSSYNYTPLYSPNGSHDTANIISNNLFYGGGYQIVWFGKSGGKLESGTEITGNTFEGTRYGGAFVYYQDSLLFNNNSLNSNVVQASFYGFYLSDCNNGTRILNNTVIINGDVNGGFFLTSCNGSISSMILAANNVISMGGTGAATGVILNSSTYIKFHNNSINMYYSTPSRPIGFIGGSGHTIMNNLFATNSDIMSLSAGVVDTLDYNCYYYTASNFGYFGGNLITTFTEWKDSTNQDANSIVADPFFISDIDLHVTNPLLNGAAIPSAGVTVDMDNEVRNVVTPDIGADEFTPPPNDAGIISYDGPFQPLCVDSSDVLVTLMNFGTSALSTVDIEWSVNGIAQTTFNWAGALASSDTDKINLGNYTFSANTSHDIKIWTANPNGGADIVNSNDTVWENNFHLAMSGIYTIGGPSPDFDSINAVAANLNYGGICGPVTFNIRSGTYDDQFKLGVINGSSAINTITFQSETGDSSDVLIHNLHVSSATNHIIYLEGTDYVTIRDLTLQADSGATNLCRVLVYDNNATFGNLLNCELIGKPTTFNNAALALIYSSNHNDSNWTITNNKFRYGSNAIYLRGASTSYEDNLVIQNNRMENNNGRILWVAYADAPLIKGNTIVGTLVSNNYSMYLQNLKNGTRVEGNHIWTDKSGVVYMTNVDGTVSDRALIANNFFTFSGTFAGTGIYSRFSDYIDIYHNSVLITNSDVNSEALYVTSGTGVKILNNIFANTGGGYATYINTPAAVDTCDFNDHYATGVNLGYWNADITTLGGWQLASNQDPNGISVDPVFTSSNDLHASETALDSAGVPVTEVTVDFDGEARNVTFPDIGADEFMLALNDAGILSIDSPMAPICGTSSDVIITLQNNGKNNLTSVDIKWTLNGSPQTTNNWTGNLAQGGSVQVILGNLIYAAFTSYDFIIWTENPNSSSDDNLVNDTVRLTNFYTSLAGGTYTIGGTSPDFNDFSTAAANLNNGGICGPVVFEARDGTYSENMRLEEIAGASAVNTVRFTSESGDSSMVTLTYASGGELLPTLELKGTDHITIDHLTLEATGTVFGQVLTILDGACFNTISNNLIIGIDTISSGYQYYVIWSDVGSLDTMNVFQNNQIMNGSNGMVYFGKSPVEFERGTVIYNNIFINQYRAFLNLEYQNGAQVLNNVMSTSNPSGGAIGIYMVNCLYPDVQSNKITMNGGKDGIKLWSVNGTNTQRGLFANNFIQVGTTQQSNGFNLGQWIDYVNVHHNSINVTSTDPGSYALYVNYNNLDSVQIYNNIFVNSGGGYAIYHVDTPDLPRYNNNCYLAGSPFAVWGSTDLDSLDDWVSRSKMDSNSLFIDPLFVSDTDLHVNECMLDGAGMPLPNITIDIDGESRDPLTPDIGADEFGVPGISDALLGNDTTICMGDSLLLDAGGGFAAYLWENSSTIQTHMASGGTHWVRVSDVCGGSVADTIMITESDPNVDLGPDTIAALYSVVLDAGAGFVTYAWSNGANTQTTEVVTTGDYSVTVTDAYGCQASDTIKVTVYIGIEDVYGSSPVRIYPNPSEGTFVIDMPSDGDHLFIMKDILGRVVAIKQIKGARVHLNMELKPGIYFAEIRMDDGQWIIPVVIRDR